MKLIVSTAKFTGHSLAVSSSQEITLGEDTAKILFHENETIVFIRKGNEDTKTDENQTPEPSNNEDGTDSKVLQITQ
jgi:hypothetical protein